jgi:acetoin utilization deacetylase AcuC-like enzyme
VTAVLPFPIVFHEGYDLDLGFHVFPAEKFGLIHDRLLELEIAGPEDFVRPEPARDADILRVHDAAWVEKLRKLTLTDLDLARLEIRVTPQGVRALWLATSGSVLAAQLALNKRIAINLGGGFHHAYPGHGEGFCALNDFAVAIRRLQADKRIQKAMVVDCDVHHGNGTAAIFADDDSVFTLSIHQLNNYPAYKPPSNIDIDLKDGTGDTEYLERLREAMVPALDQFRPEFLVYVAGADPYREDQLGGLALTLEGLKTRDRLVFDEAVRRGLPVLVVLAGGYAMNVTDTVAIHVNMVMAARDSVSHLPA